MSGQFALSQLREGLSLHCTDIEHHCDMTTRFATQEGGIKVMLKLEGNARVSFGGRPIHLDAGQGSGARPCGAILTLTRPEAFERQARRGTRERMVVITLAPDWLEASGLHLGDGAQHLGVAAWQPSARAIAIAEQLLQPDSFARHLQSLYQESRALELIGEALAARQGTTDSRLSPPADLLPAEFQRIVRLRKHLEAGDFDRLGMAEIAREIGCNSSTLQQHFRLAFGKTIFDCLRDCRLQRAADALLRQGVSVAQAAEIAGYGSQANFSTAFRRHFGVTPKNARRRL